MYNDLKCDILDIKSVLRELVTAFHTQASHIPTMPSLKRQNFEMDHQVEHSKETVTQEKNIEILSLPLLCHLDHKLEPIREVYRLWTEPYKDQRPLREVLQRPRDGYKRFSSSSRSASTIAQRIRSIVVVLEMISEDVEQAIGILQNYCIQNNLTLRQLINKIQRDLTRNRLSSKGRVLSSREMKEKPEYSTSDVFWKQLAE